MVYVPKELYDRLMTYLATKMIMTDEADEIYEALYKLKYGDGGEISE